MGTLFNGANHDFAVAKVFSDGRIDTSFYTNGYVTTPFFGGDDVIFKMLIPSTATNKILVVGSADNGGNIDAAFARYHSSNGTLDTCFHTDGKVTYDFFGEKDVAVSLSPTYGGSSYTVGVQNSIAGNQNFGFLRLETDGTLAESSEASLSVGTNGNGTIVRNITGGVDAIVQTRQSANGGYCVLGNAGNHIFAAPDYGGGFTSGFLNTSFKTTGVTVIDLGGTETGRSLGCTNTVHTAVGDNGSDFLVLNYYVGTQGLNTSFNTDGVLTVDFNGADAAYYFSPSVLIAVGKDGSAPTNFAVAKWTAAGDLNTSFSTDGKATYTPTGNAALVKYISTEASPFLVGEDTQDIVVQRITSDGRMVTSFDTDGAKAFDFGGTETLGGAVTNVGATMWTFAGGNGSDFVVGRYLVDGSWDTSFSSDGKLVIDFGTIGESAKSINLAYYSGIVYVAGDDGTNFLLSRLTTDGQLDTSFNTSGKRAYPLTGASTLNHVELQIGGLICLYGSTNTNAEATVLCVNP